ncbi:MAG: prepilin-type N-terminal cleavage/methylation domain-containing protein [Acidobacteria bacterium]|nr:prepilin-type N-terminal cleavage/methylation domain-containing protein [Acidobacteriota bacterium]
MARHRLPSRSRGFSLVELMVALLFTGLLMAGMAQVFKSSLGALTTTGERLSSARRNRMAVDLLYDDLNSAGMFLKDLSAPPPELNAANPPFYILPNMPVPGAGPDDPQTADELFIYFDQPLPIQATLGANAARSAAELVVLGQAPAATEDTFDLDCKDPSFAQMVKPGQYFVFKDSWETRYIKSASAMSGSKIVTVVAGADPNASVTGVGSTGAPSKTRHIPASEVMLFQPAQMVHYCIRMRKMDPDPAKPNGIPCLIREQGAYDPNAFAAAAGGETVITENVSGFKAYLSANSGGSWAGEGVSASGMTSGWTNGIQAAMNTQLATYGRADAKDTNSIDWFRNAPVLVRLDISTRTATKRPEYSATPTLTAAYKSQVQSLVVVPRHFGLPVK